MHAESPLPDLDDMRDPQAGQASVLLLMMLSTFLIGIMAFAVDLTGLYFHREAAQSAADAACLAGTNDMLAVQAGVTLPGSGFTPGINGDCLSSSAAPLCQYANFNGFDGAGLKNVDGANAITWTFPQSAPGVTSQGTNQFLTVSITQNVKTYFAGMFHGVSYQPVTASATCAIAYVRSAPPIVVLNPTVAGSFKYVGNPTLKIIGGPTRSLQVNSSNANAVQLTGNIVIDMSAGGPNHTGSDVAIFGGPGTAPAAYNGGTTGHWSGHDLPIADPFAFVGPPTSIQALTPADGVSGKPVVHNQDGCPDQAGCTELSQGYYPSGVSIIGNHTIIFMPGIYYFNGSLAITGNSTLRMGKPKTGSKQTDGIMFYFASGTLNIVGNTGIPSGTIDTVPSTALTCDGSAPAADLNMPAALAGDVLWGQCAKRGTYWDAGGDTTDVVGNPGSRGMLMFLGHTNNSSLNFVGNGNLNFSGTLYFHNNNYNSVVNLVGNGSTGTFVLGNIIADEISLTGNGAVNLALDPAKTIQLAKAALVQ